MKSTIQCAALVLLAALAVVDASNAQQATERYIPIGKSPGISTTTEELIGEIVRVDMARRTVEVRSRGGSRSVTMDSRTRYYLDRTKRKRANQMGGYEDCEVGRTVEVKLRTDGKADWIKIQVD